MLVEKLIMLIMVYGNKWWLNGDYMVITLPETGSCWSLVRISWWYCWFVQKSGKITSWGNGSLGPLLTCPVFFFSCQVVVVWDFLPSTVWVIDVIYWIYPPTEGCQWQITDSRTKNVMTLVVTVTECGANRKNWFQQKLFFLNNVVFSCFYVSILEMCCITG